MTLKKLKLSALLLTLVLINRPITCMQETDLEEYQIDSSIEKVPNELLLFIFIIESMIS